MLNNVTVKSLSFGSRQIRVSISILTLISSVTLDKFINISETVFLPW